jgi:hypothetical protein
MHMCLPPERRPHHALDFFCYGVPADGAGPARRAPGQAAIALSGRPVVHAAKAHSRVLVPGLACLEPRLPDDVAKRCPLATAWRQFDRALGTFMEDAMIAAKTSPDRELHFSKSN